MKYWALVLASLSFAGASFAADSAPEAFLRASSTCYASIVEGRDFDTTGWKTVALSSEENGWPEASVFSSGGYLLKAELIQSEQSGALRRCEVSLADGLTLTEGMGLAAMVQIMLKQPVNGGTYEEVEFAEDTSATRVTTARTTSTNVRGCIVSVTFENQPSRGRALIAWKEEPGATCGAA